MIDRGITKLFGVNVRIEGPMFHPVSGSLTDSEFEESLNKRYFGQETSPGFAEGYPQGQNYNDQEDLEMSRAIEASLLDTHTPARNIDGEQEFYRSHRQESRPFGHQFRQTMKEEMPFREDYFGGLRVEEDMVMSVDDVATFSDTVDADLREAMRQSLLEINKHEAGGNEVRNEAERELSEQKVDMNLHQTSLLERDKVKLSLRDSEIRKEANKELVGQEGIEAERDEDPANANRSEKTQSSTDGETRPRLETHPHAETHPRVIDDGKAEHTSISHEVATSNTDHAIGVQGNQMPMGSTDKHRRKSTQTVIGSRNSQEPDEDQHSAVQRIENKKRKEKISPEDLKLTQLIEESEKKKSIDERHGHIDDKPAPQEKGAVRSPDQNSIGDEKSRISGNENNRQIDAERKLNNFNEKTEPENVQTRISSSITSTYSSNGITDEPLVPSAENSADTAQNNTLEVSSLPTLFKTKFILNAIFTSVLKTNLENIEVQVV